MNKEVMLGQKSWKFYYFRYKDTPYYSLAIFFVTIFVCILLIISIIIPQVENWFSIRNEVIALQDKIRRINQNINILNSIDTQNTQAQLQIATAALPADKDFAPIVNAISDSALKSGAVLEDYTFQTGSMEQSRIQVNNIINKNNAKTTFTTSVTVTLNGDLSRVKKFITNLENKLPLSGITKINNTKEYTIVNIDFYQKQYPKITVKEDELIIPINAEQNELIGKLSTWQVTPLIQTSTSQSSSNSAIPLF